MKIRMTIKEVGSENTWNEEADIPGDGYSAQGIIEGFNNSLRKGEVARQLVAWAPISVDPRDDAEVIFIGHGETVVFPVDRIFEILENPSGALMSFLNDAKVGSVLDISDEMDSHFNFAVLLIPGSGNTLGIEADLPTTEAESCEECGADPSNMTWEDGGWKCGDCGSIQ